MPKDLTPFGIQQGGNVNKNLKGRWNRASLDSGWKTARKTFRQFSYNMDKFKWGFTDTKPTMSSSYKEVISRQYPKYTGPKPPNVNPRGGGWPGAHIRVQGHPMRAAGKFSTIPEGYLVNQMNKKHITARTARVAKGVATAAKIGRIANPVGAALIAYDATKWAMQWHKDNPDHLEKKYSSSYLDLSTNKPGKYGVDY